MIVTSDGKVVVVTDAVTGKIIAKIEHGKDVGTTTEMLFKHIGVASSGKTSKPDPRIEELVAAAEKINPGRGAEVPRPLEGAKKPVTAAQADYMKAVELLARTKPMSTTRVVEAQGGKRIIIVIEDGKVQQLTDLDLKKMLDQKDIQLRIERKQVESKKSDVTPTVPALPKATPKTIGVPSTPTTPPRQDDMDALRRQLERLAAELQDLKKRLDTGKK